MDTTRLTLARYRAMHFLADQQARPRLIDPATGFTTADIDVLIEATDASAPFPRDVDFHDRQPLLI